jgi:hypothetical protein
MFDAEASNAAGDADAEKEARLLTYLMIWEGTHRTLIYGVIAIVLWVSAWAIYLKNDIRNYFRNRRAHRWGVDMETKTVTSGRKGLH